MSLPSMRDAMANRCQYQTYTLSFTVVPVAVNGTGIGQIAVNDARVMVSYKLCVDAGDCP